MKGYCTVIDPSCVRVAQHINHQGINVTIAVQVTQRQTMAVIRAECGGSGVWGEAAASVVKPNSFRFVHRVGHYCVEVAVTVQIT